MKPTVFVLLAALILGAAAWAGPVMGRDGAPVPAHPAALAALEARPGAAPDRADAPPAGREGIRVARDGQVSRAVPATSEFVQAQPGPGSPQKPDPERTGPAGGSVYALLLATLAAVGFMMRRRRVV